MSALNMGEKRRGRWQPTIIAIPRPFLPAWIKPPDASNQEQLQHDDHG